MQTRSPNGKELNKIRVKTSTKNLKTCTRTSLSQCQLEVWHNLKCPYTRDHRHLHPLTRDAQHHSVLTACTDWRSKSDRHFPADGLLLADKLCATWRWLERCNQHSDQHGTRTAAGPGIFEMGCEGIPTQQSSAPSNSDPFLGDLFPDHPSKEAVPLTLQPISLLSSTALWSHIALDYFPFDCLCLPTRR